MVMSASLSSSASDRVVLPAPDGEDRTSMRPRRPTCLSLDILNLLAQLIDDGFQFEAYSRQADVCGLRAEGICFTVEFLCQEIEPAARRFASGKKLASLRHMGGQAVDLLAHIGLGRQQSGFLRQTLFR